MNSGIRNLESGCFFRYLFAGMEYLWYDTKNNRNEEEQRIEIGKKRDFTEKNLSVHLILKCFHLRWRLCDRHSDEKAVCG